VALNQEEIVLTFLFFGADPNAGGGYEGSPLLAAISHGHSRLVKILLEAGADPRSLPVLWKAARHSVEMVKLCIAKYPGFEYPIDINAFNVTGDHAVNGETPLCAACNQGKVDVVRFLLEEAAADAAVMFKGQCVPQFRSALHASIVRKDETLISLILAHLPHPNVCNSIRHGPGLLHCAIQTGKLSILQLLVDAGVKLDVNFPLDGTALQKACSANSLEMVQYLLQHHADANIAPMDVPPIYDIKCPLHVAISHGSIPMVNELLAAGADPNLHKGTLWLAAGKGNIEMVRRLLEIETLDIDGFACEAWNYAEVNGTALHHAALKGHADVLKLLLEEGADPNVRTNSLGTPLDVAIKNHHQSCVDVLYG
jgi:ankyrin repeat protein